MAKKDKAQITPIASFEEVDAKLLELASYEVIIAQEEARMNKQMQEIRDRFETNTVDARAKKAAVETQIEEFCITRKDEFEKSRSRELIHGTVGLRWTPPKIALLNRKYNWDTVVELLKRLFKDSYTRTKQEVDKEALLADYAQKTLDDQKLAGVGLKIDQREEVFIQVKWEAIDDKVEA